jgi:hypothetical protein
MRPTSSKPGAKPANSATLRTNKKEEEKKSDNNKKSFVS